MFIVLSIVEESLVADKILSMVLSVDDWKRNIPYREALKSINITSATWNCVGCTSDDDAFNKLIIIRESLLKVSVTSRKEMVLCRYVGGLRKLAQWKILKLMGYNDTESMELIKKLPF